jgi:hypothetical protein
MPNGMIIHRLIATMVSIDTVMTILTRASRRK